MQISNAIQKAKATVTAISAGALFAVAAGPVMADDFPSRSVNVTVSYSAGGATDFQARIATMAAEEYLGDPIVITNRPGAGGQVGWNHLVRRGRDDGHDLAAYNVPHFIAQSIMYDTHYSIENLEPIANWGQDPAVLIVPADSPFETVDDLVAYAEENPGSITVSGAGLFVGHHIATLQLEQAGDIELRYVPTAGGVDALRFVMGGQVQAGFNNLSDAYRNQDRLRILAVADLERDEDFLPDVPTFQELGYDIDNSSVNFRGIMAPKGPSEERLQWLSERIVEMFNDERIKAQMKEGGSPMNVMNREELKGMWQERQAFLEDLFAEMDADEIEEELEQDQP